MKYLLANQLKTTSLTLSTVAVGALLGLPAYAAAPNVVTYQGPAVTAAVPGKTFHLGFKIKNTSTENYQNVQIVFHMPNELNVASVGPNGSTTEDQNVTWSNVPMESKKSFYPTFTANLKSDTPLKTKVSIWVEVKGDNMETTSKNFSITARPGVMPVAASKLTAADINALFMTVYGRAPSASEAKYWLGRKTDKPGRNELMGAMAFHKAHNLKH